MLALQADCAKQPLTNQRTILVVVNPAAGKADYQHRLEAVYGTLTEQRLPFTTFFTERTEPSGKLRAVLKDNKSINEIWVIGGDGTLNYVVNECDNRQIPVAVVSGGTGNDSVKSMHGITDFRKQLQIALEGHIQAFDLGCCNDRLFVNGVGIGFDGKVVQRMLAKGKKNGSHLAYFVTVLQLLAGYRERRLQYAVDGVQFDEEIFLMTVSNGTTFGGGFVINPSAIANDGLLDLCIFGRIRVARRFLHLSKLRTGAHTGLKETTFHRAREVIVGPSDHLVAHLDGEFIGSPPFNIAMSTDKLLTRMPA